MATKKLDKDTIIENLKDENAALKKVNKISSWFDNLGKKRKITLLIFVLFLLFSFIFYFVYITLASVHPVSINEEEYNVLLSEINGRIWKIKDDENLKLLNNYLPYKSNGKMKTTKKDDIVVLTFDGEEKEELNFYFHDGKINGRLSSYKAIFNYSESSIKTGRAITIITGDDKIIFYEE